MGDRDKHWKVSMPLSRGIVKTKFHLVRFSWPTLYSVPIVDITVTQHAVFLHININLFLSDLFQDSVIFMWLQQTKFCNIQIYKKCNITEYKICHDKYTSLVQIYFYPIFKRWPFVKMFFLWKSFQSIKIYLKVF